MRTPYVIIALLLCAFIPLMLLGDDEDPAEPGVTPVAVIAQRVEILRQLEFDSLPNPVSVTPEQATAEGLDALDRDYPEAQRHADETLYELLGLLPPDSDLRDINGSIFGEQVAGYYDPVDGKLRIVTGSANANDIVSEITIAHELDHALEDQAIGLDLEAANASDDGGLAYKAMVEGTATAVMFTYLERYFDRETALGGILGGSFAAGESDGIPPFVFASLLFPYQAGQKFVTDLYERAGNTWTLVNLAERDRPPVSTEQILHPDKWIAVEEPDPVTLPPPPAGFERLAQGTFGEWQTSQWVARGAAGAPAIAAGWGGDRYALYSGEAGDVLVMRWVWDTEADEHAFVEALPDVLDESGAGATTYDVSDGRVTAVLGPNPTVVQRFTDGLPG